MEQTINRTRSNIVSAPVQHEQQSSTRGYRADSIAVGRASSTATGQSHRPPNTEHTANVLLNGNFSNSFEGAPAASWQLADLAGRPGT